MYVGGRARGGGARREARGDQGVAEEVKSGGKGRPEEGEGKGDEEGWQKG